MEPLIFAQMFPFTEAAKQVVKKTGLNPEDVPEQAVKRAALMVSRASSGKTYSLELNNPSKEILEYEVIAFPIAKMFVSTMRATNITNKLATMIQKSTLTNILENENNRELCTDLAKDLGIKFELSGEKEFFGELELLEFLSINFNDDELKLVNQAVENGIVYLSLKDFARFLSEKAYMKTFEALPIPKEHIPKNIQQLAKSIELQITSFERKEFDLKIEGTADPNLFPACMKEIYSQQLEGRKLPHFARLTSATFLKAVGMSQEEILNVLAKSPDYKEHMARYQLQRIFEKDLAPPSCQKIAEYGLKVSECHSVCDVKHPMQWYRREYRKKLRIKNRMKESKAKGGEGNGAK